MKLASRRIFVTGGAGFIGSHIVEALVAEGAKVTVYDDFSTGKKAWLDAVEKKIDVIQGSCLDYDRLRENTKGMEMVSHQAAQLEVFRSLDDPELDLRSNTIGTLNVLKCAVENRISKVVNASSACVYGQAISVPESEDHPKNPNWPYGVSKLAAENYCNIFSEFHHLGVTSLRYGIVYGEREWFGRVLTVFLKRAMQDEPLVLWGGNQVRDFVHVQDVVTFHNLCLRYESSSKAYNVATGVGTSIRELARIVKKSVNPRVPIIKENIDEAQESRYVKNRRRIPLELKTMVLDVGKAFMDLKWTPVVSLENGISKEAEWLRNNPGIWERDEYRV